MFSAQQSAVLFSLLQVKEQKLEKTQAAHLLQAASLSASLQASGIDRKAEASSPTIERKSRRLRTKTPTKPVYRER